MDIKTMNTLSMLVRKSPFKQLQEHMRVVFSCVNMLPPVFEALKKKNINQISDLSIEISECESKADRIKKEFRLFLPKTLFLPVARRDLLTLLNEQDGIVDDVKMISQILISRDMEVPKEICELLDELLAATIEISSKAKLMIEELDELVQVGFGGREYDKVIKMITGVRRSEHNIDTILYQIRRALFAIENSLSPVAAVFWYQLFAIIGDISDRSENMSDRLLLFLSK